MTLPAFLFGFLLSTLYGAAFHLWKGGGAARLLLYLILGWIGFWSGHLLAAYFDWTFDSLGQLHFGTATLGSLLFLGVGYWLSLVEVDRR
jgi:uncharacterized membrane protein YeaQ/YmgE (transglycosylase-associated protein family)